jgi:16S rRNA (guanine966-N2)-methyltransferase
MRIISGYLKGRKITQPNSKNTRPLKDLTKESIFNILQHSNLINFSFERSIILDLFSGVGSFGLECISRGASNVIFCENYLSTIKILKKNIIDLNCEKKAQIITDDIFKIKKLVKLNKKKFEIIFMDPPYKEKKMGNLLKDIIHLKLLKKDGIIIIHRHKKDAELLPKEFKILKIKNYGISKIIFGLIS